MAARSLAYLALVASILLTTTRRSDAQEAPQGSGKIVYESCYADLNLWDVICDIHTWQESGDVGFDIPGRRPKWSPDGTRIAYVAYTYGYELFGQLIIVNAAVPDTHTIVTADYSTVYPVDWLSNARLVFASDRTGYPELYSVNDDGAGLVQLTDGIGFTGSFAASPDGSAIAIARDVNGVRDLFRINPDGSGLTRLTTSAGYTGQRLEWSPDGTRLIFDCGAEVCGVQRDGSGFAQLTTGGGAGGVLSPTGNRLAFAAQINGAAEPVIREADGSLVRVASSTPGHTPIWFDDGSGLVFQGLGTVAYSGRCYFGGGAHNADDFCLPLTGIYTVNDDGTGLRQVGVGSNPDWARGTPGEPHAMFSGQCDGSRCRFDASASSDPDGDTLTYVWDFGDGTAGTGATATHTYARGASYRVLLIVSDAGGLSSSLWQSFYANSPPLAVFAHSCSGITCTFNGSAATDPDGTITSYYWNFGDGGSAYEPSTSHSFGNGTFTVRLIVYDDGGGYATTSTVVSIANLLPTAAFTWSCIRLSCNFNSSGSTDDGPLQFAWSFGDWAGDSGANPTHRYSTAGSYSVTLTVYDLGGQRAISTQTVMVSLEPMHLGDMDATRLHGSRGWSYPVVTVAVHAADERGVQNALVTGRWSTGETGSCYSDGAGNCSITGSQLKSLTGLTFNVTGVSLHEFVYAPAANHDPDGDSTEGMIRFR